MTARVTLPPRLDTAAAAALGEELQSLDEGPVNVDASQVSFLGALCLESLLHARHERAEITIDGATEAFRAGLKTFGLSETEFTSGDDG